MKNVVRKSLFFLLLCHLLQASFLQANLHEEPCGSYFICPVCFWEDDDVENKKPGYQGGANRVSLNEAKKNFILHGACEKRFAHKVRSPIFEEKNQES